MTVKDHEPVYARNCWYVAGWSDEISEGQPYSISILGEPIVFFRRNDGKIAALENRCIHRHAALSLGRCENGQLRCMYHGILFDATGQVTEIPGQDLIPAQARVRNYPCVERHSWVWVWMGDPERADAAAIPATVGLDDPEYLLGHGQLDYEAEAKLINDNLLDFSHLTYVHEKSFGAGNVFAQELPKVVPLENGVRFERWLTDNPGPVGRRTGDLVDGWMSYSYLVPGILIMKQGVFKTGTARQCNMGEPDFADAIGAVSVTSQAVTPVGRKKARYFFSTGPRRDHGDETLRDAMMAVTKMAFEEDKVMIESQQRIIDTDPNRKMMPISADKGVTIFNRLVEKFDR